MSYVTQILHNYCIMIIKLHTFSFLNNNTIIQFVYTIC